MPNPVLKRLVRKSGYENILSNLDKLSLSEFSSLLMEVFRIKAGAQEPHELLKAYASNRFVRPSSVDPLTFLKTELSLMELARQSGFTLMELSPLTPLGSASSVALVDQNKIVSALRGTEVVADATNVLALEAASQRIDASFDSNDFHGCANHRHVRAQGISGKGFTAHFKIFCAVSAGKDSGNFLFERNALTKHLQLYQNFFHKHVDSEVKFTIKSLTEGGKENLLAQSLWQEVSSQFKNMNISFVNVPLSEHRYYHALRFSIDLVYNGVEYNIGDGGFVDWAEKLTGNKKERMLTSGLGTEFLLKLINGKL